MPTKQNIARAPWGRILRDEAVDDARLQAWGARQRMPAKQERTRRRARARKRESLRDQNAVRDHLRPLLVATTAHRVYQHHVVIAHPPPRHETTPKNDPSTIPACRRRLVCADENLHGVLRRPLAPHLAAMRLLRPRALPQPPTPRRRLRAHLLVSMDASVECRGAGGSESGL